MKNYKKVLILGSGALKIGEAGEFDYSGSQAMKALRESGVKIVLINPNIATIQTSPLLADEIYFLPVTPEYVERVIEKERPEGILLSFGGQTALNCGLELHRRGVLKKYRVKVLGTPIEAIVLTEDREKFAAHLRQIGIPVPRNGAATTLEQAEKISQAIGFPVMVRAAYALGGQKSGVARNEKELKQIVGAALSTSPQVLVEKYLHHFKELEYEVVRDAADNCVTVCNMENMDPLGIHTGDSIVVAPSQTLTNAEYHGLREASIKIVRSLGIVGECNVQFAVNPRPHPHLSSPLEGEVGRGGGFEYYVIEVNARLSRSSALASKATGYPLAYVAAHLALGKTLGQIPNQVTRVTQSFFEPALDYVVVKIPRWDLEKFRGAQEQIGSAMKSVGEVMAIGRTFEEALQKGSRMLTGKRGFTEKGSKLNRASIRKFLSIPTPRRLPMLAAALRHGFSVREISRLTGIDPWFLYRIKNIIDAEISPPKIGGDGGGILRLKQIGFSDKRIGELTGKTEKDIRQLRHKHDIRPSVFQIDTLAGEVPARTNYLYLTYNGSHDDVPPLGKKSVMVLGSGPYHIGSSVEFDWSCVHTALALRARGKKSIIINCNPETVSTDYDMSDRLYFEELSFETVSDIADFEGPAGVVVSVGGQTPNNLAERLSKAGLRLLGTRAEDIDRAEDRNKFSRLLDELQIPQPRWRSCGNAAAAGAFADEVGYPVLVRPSYVLSGSAMSVCFSAEELKSFVRLASEQSGKHPVTVSKFFMGSREIELDGVAQKGEIQALAVSEHLENAGVHSGDATIVYPTQQVFVSTDQRIREISAQLARALRITGPFNIQFLVKDRQVYVIELNLRASRTFPMLSKSTGVNFAEKAVASFYDKSKPEAIKYPDYVVVKSPQFSFARLSGADPVLRVEMASTGEVACFGENLEEALLKSISASATLRDTKAALLSIGGSVNKKRFLEAGRLLRKLGYHIYATGTTAQFLQENGVAAELVYKLYEDKQPNVLQIITNKAVAFVINISDPESQKHKHFTEHLTDGYHIRRATVDAHVPLFTDLHLARAFVRALTVNTPEQLKIKSWREYLK